MITDCIDYLNQVNGTIEGLPVMVTSNEFNNDVELDTFLYFNLDFGFWTFTAVNPLDQYNENFDSVSGLGSGASLFIWSDSRSNELAIPEGMNSIKFFFNK